ncbi:MAG TPA: TIR domain-containing protein [Steroidobacteraceae bacterium]|nr:TIR domain-containing protein [Steroidobacteraceae bacterium]
MNDSDKAVFLSYASEDAAAAARICAGLHAAGVEVWFDQSELRGGDAWDHRIRTQIRDCALFIPIISGNTQSRSEGYFRLEWDLAEQRSRMIVRSKAFIVPVCIDDTSDGRAEVPESFFKVQWTRLPEGVTTQAFCERIATLVGGSDAHKSTARSMPATAVAAAVPARRSFPWWVAMGAMLIAAAVGWQVWRVMQSKPARPVAVAAAAVVPEKSIAVLPFVDMSEKRDQEYFSDGLSEELIDRLSHNPDLKVIARTSSFVFKGKNQDIRTIASTLGVATVLEGSVRKAGNQLRITAQLIRALDGVDLWSESYERQLTDVFKVQQEIAAAVVKGLQAKLLPPTVAPNSAPHNMEAYSLYLRGQYFARRGSDEAVAQGITILKQAIALEPEFAPAHVELANSYFYVGTFGTGNFDFVVDSERENDEALRLDPTLRSALNLRANLALVKWDWSGAKAQLDELLASGPHDSGALLRRGQMARAFGHEDQALVYFREALQLDPLSVIGHVQLAMLLDAMGRSAEARTAAEVAIAINPEVTKAHLLIALQDLQAGHLDAASATLERETGEYYRLEGQAILAFVKKRMPESNAALGKLIDAYHATAAVQIAQTFAYRGERAKAFEWLDQAFAQKDPGLVNVKTDPLLASLHGDARFAKLLRRMNLPAS